MNKDSGPINDCQKALISLSEISPVNNSRLCLSTSFTSQVFRHPKVIRSS